MEEGQKEKKRGGRGSTESSIFIRNSCLTPLTFHSKLSSAATLWLWVLFKKTKQNIKTPTTLTRPPRAHLRFPDYLPVSQISTGHLKSQIRDTVKWMFPETDADIQLITHFILITWSMTFIPGLTKFLPRQTDKALRTWATQFRKYSVKAESYCLT